MSKKKAVGVVLVLVVIAIVVVVVVAQKKNQGDKSSPAAATDTAAPQLPPRVGFAKQPDTQSEPPPAATDTQSEPTPPPKLACKGHCGKYPAWQACKWTKDCGGCTADVFKGNEGCADNPQKPPGAPLGGKCDAHFGETTKAGTNVKIEPNHEFQCREEAPICYGLQFNKSFGKCVAKPPGKPWVRPGCRPHCGNYPAWQACRWTKDCGKCTADAFEGDKGCADNPQKPQTGPKPFNESDKKTNCPIYGMTGWTVAFADKKGDWCYCEDGFKRNDNKSGRWVYSAENKNIRCIKRGQGRIWG